MIEMDRIPLLADIVKVQAETHADQPALWFEGRTTTYIDLNTRSAQVANALISARIKPGDRVAYLAKNTDTYYQILFGAAKARAALAGINTRLAVPEMAYILNDAGATLLFVGEDFYEAAEKLSAMCAGLKTIITLDKPHGNWPDFQTWCGQHASSEPDLTGQPDDDVIQLYTSGTTGLPKGVCLTNGNYRALLHQAAQLEWAAYARGDAVMNAMPFFHVAGVNVGILALAQGAEAVILREVDPALILRLIPEKRIVHAFWVPAVILMLTQTPGIEDVDFTSLKMVSYGASPIADSVLNAARTLLGSNTRFTQVYGLTETTGGGTYLPPEAHDPAWGKLRSCGVPYPGAIIRCVDPTGAPVPTGEVGEIVIQSDFVMKGYWNKPDATTKAIKNGFFYTGDAGYFDADGFLYIHDRVKDMIVSGGENIYPAEVENALFDHPDIADVAVIGVPDETWGEAVKAIIVAKPGADPDSEEIIAWAKARIAGYKCPKSLDRVDALPRNPSGKVLRKVLREPYWTDKDRRVG